MGFIGILLLVVAALFVIMIKLVIDGIRAKNWKKAIISLAIFLAIVALMYFALLRFITSM